MTEPQQLNEPDQAPDAAEPGGEPDARALRAFTHPLRWKLGDLVYSEGTATATRCAEVLGESEASCSYHLRILAKYGWIEPAPVPPGSRERPWRVARRRQNLFPAHPDEKGALAAEAAGEAFLDHELGRLKQRLRHASLEPEQWQQAARLVGVTTWLTAEELREISDQLEEIVLRHVDRGHDPALRPDGAREVRLLTATTVAPPLPPPNPGNADRRGNWAS